MGQKSDDYHYHCNLCNPLSTAGPSRAAFLFALIHFYSATISTEKEPLGEYQIGLLWPVLMKLN
jgi:hypothetical protein